MVRRNDQYIGGGYFSAGDLAALRLYKYRSIDLSPVSKYVLQPFWEAVARGFPRWLAPNMVTLIGFAWPILNLVLCAWFNPNLDPSVHLPPWVYLSLGVGLFFYQTMDGCDGKQARNTGTSSPLGHLFDHGCDSLNTAVSSVVLSCALGFGPRWQLINLLMGAGAFWCATWEEYHTGVLFLGVISGPVEGLLMIIAAYLGTYWTGPGLWTSAFNDVTGLQWELTAGVPFGEALAGGMAIGVVITMISSAVKVAAASKEQGEGIDGQGVWHLDEWLPYLMVSAGAVLWASEGGLAANPWLMLVAVGFCYAQICSRVIVCHLLDLPLPRVQAVAWIPLAGALLCNNAYVGNEVVVVFLFCAALVSYVDFVWVTVDGFSRFLKIRLLTIPYVAYG